MKGKIVLVAAVAIILIITNMFASNHSTSHTLGFPSEPHPANAMWIEPSYISLSTDLYDVGYRFNITVWVNITSVPSTNQTITAWQFVIAYNKTQLNVTRCGYTAGDKSEFFSNITTVPIDPQFGSFNETHNYVMHGESWASGPKRTVPGYGSLSWIEFEVIAKPPTGQAHVSLITLITTGVRKSKILDDELNRVSFTPYNSFYSFGQYSVEVPIRGEGNATIRGNVVITKIVVTKNTIHFDVTGPSGYKGWINVTFPMINKTRIKVFLDGNKIPPENLTITSNSTHYFIYFEFTCSTHEITIQYAITNVAITNITLVPQKRCLNINVEYSLSWNILVISIHINDEKTVPYTGTIYVKIRGAGYTHSITVQPRGEDIQVELYIPPSSLIPLSPPLNFIIASCILIIASFILTTISFENLFLGLSQ